MLSSIHAIAARLLQSNDPKLAVLLDQRIRELMAQPPECQEAAAAAQRPGVRVTRVLPRGPEVSDAAAGATPRIIHIRRPTQRRAKGRTKWACLCEPASLRAGRMRVLCSFGPVHGSDHFGDAIVEYDFWNSGSGGGHCLLNNKALGANQENVVSAAQLASTTYVSGPGTDTLWVRVSEGGQWSAWSPAFSVSDPTTIGAGETLELTSASSDAITFTGDTGTLKLDHPASFAGSVAGMSGQDTIDLADIDASQVATPSYSGDASGGTLRVTDGVHAAKIALLGNYLAAAFVTSSDGHSGTMVSDPAVVGGVTPVVMQAHA